MVRESVLLVGRGCGTLVLILSLTSACGTKAMDHTTASARWRLSDQQISTLVNEKIVFGHQSVGANILQGVRELMVDDSRLKLRIIASAEPASVSGPAFVETSIGKNTEPASKDEAFADIVNNSLGNQRAVIMYKYCYVDINASTDVRQLFHNYREGIDLLHRSHPTLKVVHITVPLITAESAAEAWIKSVLGKTTMRAADEKRNEYNNLLRQTYADKEPVFDLAEVESTHTDGTRSYFMSDRQKIYTLASEYTGDGSHLNEAGRRAAAQRLLTVLSTL
jgi:hypothetical protein